MTAQPQLVQGCTICGVPSDPESEMRETAEGGRLGGGGLSFGDFSLATQRKVTRPGPKGGRNFVEGGALVFHGAEPHQGVPCRFGARTVAVEREFAAVQCTALIAPYSVPLRCKTTPSHPIRERPNTLRYSNLRFDNAGGLWVPSP